MCHKIVKISLSLFSCTPSVWKTHGVYTSVKNTRGRYTHTFCLVSASSTSHYSLTMYLLDTLQTRRHLNISTKASARTPEGLQLHQSSTIPNQITRYTYLQPNQSTSRLILGINSVDTFFCDNQTDRMSS